MIILLGDNNTTPYTIVDLSNTIELRYKSSNTFAVNEYKIRTLT